MLGLAVRAREVASKRRQRVVRPALEGLEDRMLLYSVTGDHFAFGSRITWSIMPDGTSLGGIPSNFVSTMNAKFGANNWQSAIQDAFAQWENVANVNLAQVPDDGAPFGAGPDQQGSPEYGDIRIGGFAQAQNILAFTLLPPTSNGGSDSGDILFNTSQPWNIGSNYDLETVALHEVGHALGLGHSAAATAVMYPYYGGVEQAPTSDDVAGVQAVWGPRQEDLVWQNNGQNNVSSRAADITSFMTASNDQTYMPRLDVANTGEAYWFKFTTPANASNVLVAQVQSNNLSELSPRVQIYNASLQGLVQATAPANAYGVTIAASIANATPNTVYYVKVLGSNAGPTGTGGYALTINMGSSPTAASPPPNTTVAAQPDQGPGADLLTVGGPGTVIKEVALAGEKDDAESPKVEKSKTPPTPPVDDGSKSPKATSTQATAAVPIGLLQDVPAGNLGGPSSASGTKSSGGISATQLDAIVSGLFAN